MCVCVCLCVCIYIYHVKFGVLSKVKVDIGVHWKSCSMKRGYGRCRIPSLPILLWKLGVLTGYTPSE